MKKSFSMFLNFCFYFSFLSLAITFPSTSFAEDYIILSNAENNIHSLTTLEIKKIMLGKKTLWNETHRIKVGYVNSSTSQSEIFFREVLNMSKYKFNRYWRRKLFSGNGVPPRRFRTQEELIEFVKSEPLALGLAFDDVQSTDVSVVEVIEH